jgi:hypothetical protein
LIILYSASCQQKNVQLSHTESIFLDKLLQKDQVLKKGIHIVFIANRSECGMCEDEALAFYNEDFSQTEKTFVVPQEDEYYKKWKNKVRFPSLELARYGLANTSGDVFILKDGVCVFKKTLVLGKLKKLKKEMLRVLNEKP